MKAYLCRLIEDGLLCELGVVVARSEAELFGVLDEFTNPYVYEFSNVRAGDPVFTPAQWVVEDDTGDCDSRFAMDDHYCYCKLAKNGPFTFISEESGDHTKRKWRRFTGADIDVVNEHASNWVVESAPCR